MQIRSCRSDHHITDQGRTVNLAQNLKNPFQNDWAIDEFHCLQSAKKTSPTYRFPGRKCTTFDLFSKRLRLWSLCEPERTVQFVVRLCLFLLRSLLRLKKKTIKLVWFILTNWGKNKELQNMPVSRKTADLECCLCENVKKRSSSQIIYGLTKLCHVCIMWASIII